MAGERQAAIDGLIREAVFQPLNDRESPYIIFLTTQNNHIVLNIKNAGGIMLPAFGLSLSPYRRIMRDYFMMIDSYEQARAHQVTPGRLEAIDMGRRGLHDEAGHLVIDRLKDKVHMDHPTARRFFTLICSLSDLKSSI